MNKAGILIGLVMVLIGAVAYGLTLHGYGGFAHKNYSAEVNLPPVDPNKVAQVLPVTKADHIIGNPDADFKIVEFADTECPECKAFQLTMVALIQKYGSTGKVAWVYRHFPLSIHPKARKEAEATECAYDQGGLTGGGNEKFFTYLNGVFGATNSNNSLPEEKLTEIAKSAGLDADKFSACLSSGKFAGKIDQSYKDALAAGGRGTPYLIFMTKDGQAESVLGAQSYPSMVKIVDYLINPPATPLPAPAK